MQNFSKIAIPLILIFQTTSHETFNFQAGEKKKIQNILDSDDSKGIGKDIKNLSIITKSAKSKKLNFAKNKLLEIDFLTFEAKEAFIYLREAFTKTLILRHFDSKCYIYLKTNTSGYTIGGIFCQMTLSKFFSDQEIYKSFDLNCKSEIDQQYLVPFFLKKIILTKI